MKGKTSWPMPRTPATKLRKPLGHPTYRTENIRTAKAQREKVWGVVRQFTGHPMLMEWASDFLREYQVPERDPYALAAAVQRYAQEHVKFFRERPERFASPLRTIQWGFGDCDDKSILIAAVLRSFRVPVRLVFVRYEVPQKDGSIKRISHVYPQFLHQGQWLALESVHPWPVGKDPANEARMKGLTPTTEVIGP